MNSILCLTSRNGDFLSTSADIGSSVWCTVPGLVPSWTLSLLGWATRSRVLKHWLLLPRNHPIPSTIPSKKILFSNPKCSQELLLLPTEQVSAIPVAEPDSSLGQLDNLQEKASDKVFGSLAQRSGHCWPWDSVVQGFLRVTSESCQGPGLSGFKHSFWDFWRPWEGKDG